MQEIKTSKQFVCSHPGCNKEYSTKFALKRHAITHSGKKQFKCKYCDKMFALEQYKKEHEYIHTNETPYVWGIDGCTEAFRQRAKLCLHRMSHKNYKKKNYKVYSRKDTVKKATKPKNNQMVSNLEMFNFGNQMEDYQFNNYMIDPSTQDMLNTLMNGWDNSNLLSTLSSKYCLWDYFDGGLNYQYPGLYDLSYMIGQPNNMEKARSNLSTLQIPKGSAVWKSSDDQLTPRTKMESPTIQSQIESVAVPELTSKVLEGNIQNSSFVSF